MNFAGSNDSLKVIFVNRCRLRKSAPQARTRRGERELEDVVDGVKDQALQPRLENRESISTLWQNIRLILPFSKGTDVHPVPI